MNEEREATLKAWQRQGPLVAKKPARFPIAMVGIAALSAALAYALWPSSTTKAAPKSKSAPLNLGGREKAPPLPKPKDAPTTVAESPAPPPPAGAMTPAVYHPEDVRRQAAEIEREKQEAEKARREREARDAQRKISYGRAPQRSAAPLTAPATSDSRGAPVKVALGSQDANSVFARSVAGAVPVSKAGRVADLEHKVLQGKVIEGILRTAVSSDLPGQAVAQIDRDLYGEKGREVLLPAGSRLIGTYSSTVRKGQDRVFVVWTRAMTPDGVDMVIDSNGADALGRVGMAGDVNHHWGQVLGVAGVLSLIGAGAATVGVSPEDRNNSIAAYRSQIQASMGQSANEQLRSYAHIPPTIDVPAGSRISIVVMRDLDFSGVARE